MWAYLLFFLIIYLLTSPGFELADLLRSLAGKRYRNSYSSRFAFEYYEIL